MYRDVTFRMIICSHTEENTSPVSKMILPGKNVRNKSIFVLIYLCHKLLSLRSDRQTFTDNSIYYSTFIFQWCIDNSIGVCHCFLSELPRDYNKWDLPESAFKDSHTHTHTRRLLFSIPIWQPFSFYNLHFLLFIVLILSFVLSFRFSLFILKSFLLV